MKNTVVTKSLTILLIALFSVAAFAAGASMKDLILSSPTKVGDKVLPPGNYKVIIGPDFLKFSQSGVPKDKAAESTVKVSSEPTNKPTTVLMMTVQDGSDRALSTITFAGQDVKYIIAR